jgi:hypothetical protein
MQTEILKTLMAHAVGQFGRDRFYTVRFGCSTPIVRVYEDEDNTKLADFWMSNDVIQEKKFY